MILGKYSFGAGDRFGHQGKAQLEAVMQAAERGVDITPVWNKSNREHTIIGTRPADVRREADDAVAACGWEGAYFVDADHIGLGNVDEFIESSDFFTLDVADFIAKSSAQTEVKAFVEKYAKYVGSLAVGGLEETFEISADLIRAAAGKFLLAVKEAGKTYRHIEAIKGEGNFITEISMDETDHPQTPIEMLFILAAVADEGIPAQTIAPNFSGRFNKGVDYVGAVEEFAKEFEQDLAIVAFAVEEFGLPAGLKLSVHSGSDKFSIYGCINKALRKFNAGVHVKTAGTTWLEELIGLAMAGGNGLDIARSVYRKALLRIGELCGPDATGIEIDTTKLPSAEGGDEGGGQRFAAALRPNQACEHYNPDFRQLLHVGYKVAAEMGRAFTDALVEYQDIIGQNVTENIYERHIKPVFVGDSIL